MPKWIITLLGSLLAITLISGCKATNDQNPPPPTKQNENRDQKRNKIDNVNDRDGNINDRTNRTNMNNRTNQKDTNTNNRDNRMDINNRNTNRDHLPGTDRNVGPGDDEKDNQPDPEDVIEDPKDMRDKDRKDE